MGKEMQTITEVIQRMRENHYTHDFEIMNDKVVCKELREEYLPEELMIEKVYRFEGDSNPDDMSIVYGILTKYGARGILIDAYGPYADSRVAEVIKEIPVKSADKALTG